MTRDDIIRMAREVGFDAGISDEHWGPRPFIKRDDMLSHKRFEALERFAELVAAQEREECAKTCEDGLLWGQRYAAAIREREMK
jgi:hypothetical protein